MQQPTFSDFSISGDGTSVNPFSALNWPSDFPLQSPKYLQFSGQAIAAGQNPFYTVPAGRRAIWVNLTALNLSGANITFVPVLQLAGVNYSMNAGTLIASNATNLTTPWTYVAEAGETFSINATGAPGFPYNFFCVVLEFSTASLTASAKLSPSAIVAGNNTIFTCPPKFIAILSTPNLPVGFVSAATFIAGPVLLASNQSGATRTYNVFIVPSGSTPVAANQIIINKTLTNLSQSSNLIVPLPCILNPGDSVVVNSDSNAAGQLIALNYCLRPA